MSDETKKNVWLPRLPYIISIYHVLVIGAGVGTIIGILYTNHEVFSSSDQLTTVVGYDLLHSWMAICSGAIGGTIVASRYVVFAVRHRTYDSNRVLWQLLTPLYSAALAFIAVLLCKGGVMTIGSNPSTNEPQATYFFLGLAFIVGFASELFVKRLILASEALFGERGDLDKVLPDREGAGNEINLIAQKESEKS